MPKLSISYEESLLVGLGISEQEFNEEARLMIAAKLYETGRISSGAAAGFAGLGRVDFLHMLQKFGTPMSNLTSEDVRDDIAFGLDG